MAEVGKAVLEGAGVVRGVRTAEFDIPGRCPNDSSHGNCFNAEEGTVGVEVGVTRYG